MPSWSPCVRRGRSSRVGRGGVVVVAPAARRHHRRRRRRNRLRRRPRRRPRLRLRLQQQHADEPSKRRVEGRRRQCGRCGWFT